MLIRLRQSVSIIIAAKFKAVTARVPHQGELPHSDTSVTPFHSRMRAFTYTEMTHNQ
jgi:hypothetical protein